MTEIATKTAICPVLNVSHRLTLERATPHQSANDHNNVSGAEDCSKNVRNDGILKIKECFEAIGVDKNASKRWDVTILRKRSLSGIEAST